MELEREDRALRRHQDEQRASGDGMPTGKVEAQAAAGGDYLGGLRHETLSTISLFFLFNDVQLGRVRVCNDTLLI
jgi:hypothetical protein